MGELAAKEGDRIVGTDTHVVLVPSGASEVATPMQFPFNGVIGGGVSANVWVDGKRAAVVGSTATNTPSHVAPVGRFQKEPENKGTIHLGSTSVYINREAAAHAGHKALTCNDPADLPNGTVVATGTVWIG